MSNYALSYHLYNGIRHLLTDFGFSFHIRFIRDKIKTSTTQIFIADLLIYALTLSISIIFLSFGVPVIAFCDDGDEQTSSEKAPDAGIGAQQSSGTRPQGEGASNCDAGPSYSKGEQDLNVTPNPHQAMHELCNDLMKAEHHLDELKARGPSLRNARDIDSWLREFSEVEQFFYETEQRLNWAMENVEDLYAAQDEESARQEAEFNKKIALHQYQMDRMNQKNKFLRNKLARMDNGSSQNE
jgi:hypothetical protein